MGYCPPNTRMIMISLISVRLKDLFELGQEYPWKMPEKCPRCGCDRVWGHGYVSACFDGYAVPLWLKRYRCPCCSCVIRMRPCSHFRGFQASIDTIRSTLMHRLTKGRWPPGLFGSRPRHWLEALKRKGAALLGNTWIGDLMGAFDLIAVQGHIPVSRSL